MDESNFLKLCRERRSVRRFSEQPVEREKLMLALEAARLAPSADNGQPWRFVVFDEPELKQALADAVFQGVFAVSRHFARAPVLVALLIKENLLINRLGGGVAGNQFQLIDAGIAGEHFVLACAEQGLGTCWIGWFDSRALVRHLKLGRGFRAVALIAVGYPAGEQKRELRRKPLAEIAFFNTPPK
ncbi:MAG: nitroreductase family protein [candidate division WOR-3 bacterium]|jgi:nitroreductase